MSRHNFITFSILTAAATVAFLTPVTSQAAPATGSPGAATQPASTSPGILGAATATKSAPPAVHGSCHYHPDHLANGKTVTAQPVPKFKDVNYQPGDPDPQKLDIYWPPTKPSQDAKPPQDINAANLYKTVLVVHGGCFSYGDKSGGDLNDPMDRLLAEGYAVVSVSYHKSNPWSPDPKTRYAYPRAEQDVWQALVWLRSNGAKYQLDAKRISAFGYSAGATLAAELGVKPAPEGVWAAIQNPDSNPDSNPQSKSIGEDQKAELIKPVSSVVDMFGRMDFETPSATKANILGNQWDCAESYLQKTRNPQDLHEFDVASPVHDLNKDSSRFLVIHGDRDVTVETQQSRTLFQRLQKVPGRKKADVFVVIEGATHMLSAKTGEAWSDSAATDEAWEAICRFLSQELK